MSKHWIRENNPNYKKDRLFSTCITCGKKIKKGCKFCSTNCYAKLHPNKKLDQEGLSEKLKDLYIKQKLTTIQIARIFKCNPKTITHWMDKFTIPRRTRSEIFKMNNPTIRPDVREKMRVKAKERWNKNGYRQNFIDKRSGKKLSEKQKERISKSLRGNKYRKGKPHSKETKDILRRTSVELWQNPEYVKKVVTALQETPNNFEMKLIKIIEAHNFPFKYVGDGQVIIGSQLPDFIATDSSKKVIELFGKPWHDPDHSKKIKVKLNRTEAAKMLKYRNHGYSCLVIWDYELKDEESVIERIKTFANGV